MAKKKKKQNILVIDDSSTDRDIFKIMLTNEGFDVDLAASAKEGFSILYDRDFDLILCDYLMPEIDGEEFLKKLRKDPKLKHYIVMVITSDESKDVKVRLLKAGANDFIHKGCAYEEMIGRIETHLRAQEAAGTSGGTDQKTKLGFNEAADNLSDTINDLNNKIKAIGNKKDKTQLTKSVTELKSSLKKIKSLVKKL